MVPVLPVRAYLLDLRTLNHLYRYLYVVHLGVSSGEGRGLYEMLLPRYRKVQVNKLIELR
jgi:hypothetical protein